VLQVIKETLHLLFFLTEQLTFLRICQQVCVTKFLSIFSNANFAVLLSRGPSGLLFRSQDSVLELIEVFSIKMYGAS